jgi:hypothetical protein
MYPVLSYFIGLDLGKDQDYSAIAVMACRKINDGPFNHMTFHQPTRPILELVSLTRIPLGTEYLEVMSILRRVITRLLSSNAWGARPPAVYLVVDSAGPGQVAIELIRAQQLRITIVPTLLSGGTETNLLRSGKYSIPRREILSNARLLLEAQTLRVAAGLQHFISLRKELVDARPGGEQSNHDDLAIAAALAAWHATRVYPDLIRRRAA